MQALVHAENYLRDKLKSKESLYQLTIEINHAQEGQTTAFITLRDTKNARAGQIYVEKALHSGLQKTVLLTDKQVKNCAIIHAATFTDDHSQTLLPLLSYFALRQARIWQCHNIIALNQENKLLRLAPLAYLPRIFAQQLSYSIYQAYEACDETERAFIQTYFIYEILDTFKLWVTNLFQDSWFSSIKTRSISKEQYVSTLYNLHAFVKHTTRLAARCVAFCESRELRNHYIHHLKGEINHEVIIESDLKALHADVDYLLQANVAHPATEAFMVLQESITGFKQDAVLMMACPFIAEGMTANISSQFVDDLHATIKTWGIKSPESVSRFLTSHMKTDGGDDGHWVRVIMMMDKFIKTENQLQQFLNTLQLAMSSYARGLNANIDDMELWRLQQSHAILEKSTI
ncbi:MAG: hypothetical protein ACD_42C00523G0002 [uncultured bacterium]|nr:MAG: hypothetical protein ACD_42C00523G0002 [uncultured bacterium]